MARNSLMIEGLRIALEMERRGGNLFRRARQFSDDKEMCSLLESLEKDEALHLEQFTRMLNRLEVGRLSEEEDELVTAKAAEFFFPGGLMQVAMDGAFSSPAAMLDEAVRAEEDSITFYKRFLEADMPQPDREIVEVIIREEEGHLRMLSQKRQEIIGGNI